MKTEIALPDGDLKTYDFNGADIQLIPHDGDLWVTGEAIGGALGYPEPRKAISKMYERNTEEISAHSCYVKLTTQSKGGLSQRRSFRVYNEEAVMIITMLSRQPKAAEFRAWAVQILKAYRRGELIMATPGQRDTLLELCIRESGNGNVAAMDTLVNRYGYRPELHEEQKMLTALLRGRLKLQLPEPGDLGGDHALPND